jgi:type I restriction enzyme S subunit
LSVADEIEKELEQALARSERLRQSILKRTFEGKLVEQHQEDGDVRELDENIKQEKIKQLNLF